MKSPKILAITAIIMALIAIPITATKQATASNPQNNPIEDDILYLRRFPYNNLTIMEPTEKIAERITVWVGATVTRRWVNETTPQNEVWIISSGSYVFKFWISSTNNKGVHATVSFTFGCLNGTQRIPIAGGTSTINNVGITTRSENITVRGIPEKSIKPGSKLFIEVSISAFGSPGAVHFYYDGLGQPTRIETPTISRIVPEFPFGMVFLPLALLSAYFTFRKCIVKFRL